jgi:enoyl-CoA hydratase
MGERVTYRLAEGVASIGMDDGKVNALSAVMLGELDAAFERARADGAVVMLTGRPGVLSAGFDLEVLRAGGLAALALLRAGFELSERILAFPTPVVVAASGHAMAMGAFLALSGDHRIGAAGPYKFTVNEVAIGMTMPRAGVEICRQRLAPSHFSRAALLSEVYTPEAAIEAGFLDQVVPAADLAASAMSLARSLAKLDMKAHAQTKMRVRGPALQAIRQAIRTDQRELFLSGVPHLLLSALRSAGARR